MTFHLWVYTGYSLWWIIWIYSSEVAPFPQFHLYFPLAFYLFFTKNDHILMHPFMCARIIHHLVVVGHILHNFTSAQILNTYKNILHDFVHKLWLFCLVPSKIFCYCCQFESDVEAEFIDLIEYTAKICNKDDIACGVALKL